jgi:hypothetical protein
VVAFVRLHFKEMTSQCLDILLRHQTGGELQSSLTWTQEDLREMYLTFVPLKVFESSTLFSFSSPPHLPPPFPLLPPLQIPCYITGGSEMNIRFSNFYLKKLS